MARASGCCAGWTPTCGGVVEEFESERTRLVDRQTELVFVEQASTLEVGDEDGDGMQGRWSSVLGLSVTGDAPRATFRRMPSQPGSGERRVGKLSARIRPRSIASKMAGVAPVRISTQSELARPSVGAANFTFHGQTSLQTSQPNAQPSQRGQQFRRRRSPRYSMVRYERHRVASSTRSATNASVGQASRQRVHDAAQIGRRPMRSDCSSRSVNTDPMKV